MSQHTFYPFNPQLASSPYLVPHTLINQYGPGITSESWPGGENSDPSVSRLSMSAGLGVYDSDLSTESTLLESQGGTVEERVSYPESFPSGVAEACSETVVNEWPCAQSGDEGIGAVSLPLPPPAFGSGDAWNIMLPKDPLHASLSFSIYNDTPPSAAPQPMFTASRSPFDHDFALDSRVSGPGHTHMGDAAAQYAQRYSPYKTLSSPFSISASSMTSSASASSTSSPFLPASSTLPSFSTAIPFSAPPNPFASGGSPSIPPAPIPRAPPKLQAYRRRNRQVDASSLPPSSALDPYKCPHCPKVLVKGKSKADFRKHVKSHTSGSGSALLDWLCVGIPYDVASPEERARAEASGRGCREYGGMLFVGGCGVSYSRPDSFARHFKNKAGRECLGSQHSEWLQGNKEKTKARKSRRASAPEAYGDVARAGVDCV